MTRSRRRRSADITLLAALVLILTGGGCSGPAPTGPAFGTGSEPAARTATATAGGTQLAADPSSGRTAGTSAVRGIESGGRRVTIGKRPEPRVPYGGVDTLPASPSWYTVASKSMTPLLGGVAAGSRYRVTVPPLALSQSATISIREHSPDVIDFELLPHGIQFLLPVTVEVDYSGTVLDPASPDYDGGLPLLLWFNTTTGNWELVLGVNDPLTRTYTVLLTHFSRYAAGSTKGTAEW